MSLTTPLIVSTNSIVNSIDHQCYNINFFQKGLNYCQAKIENIFSTPYFLASSSYSYYSGRMTGEMCATSCLKNNFIYAALISG